MPRGKSKPELTTLFDTGATTSRRVQKEDEWGGFVQISVDEAHREEFDLWASEMSGRIYDELDDALGSGLKLTMAYDGANQCYIASLTGRPDVAGIRSFTCCLSARAGTFGDAIAVLMYKHVALLHGDWWDAVNEPRKARYTFG
jgi:hypothetical protein